MSTYHTPAEVAAALQMKIDRVYGLIGTGQLEAVNIASNRTGKPRWRISQEQLEQFLRSRQNVLPAAPARRRRRPQTVTQYF